MADSRLEPVGQKVGKNEGMRGGPRWLNFCLSVVLAASLLLGSVRPTASQSPDLRADALVIINSNAGASVHFQDWIQPYLDHFGIPYTLWDLAAAGSPPDFSAYAVIIIGHDQLDYNNDYLTPAIQSLISDAVNGGTGLVNFDSDLASGDFLAYYSFVQDIFNFTYYPTDPATLIRPNSSPALGGYITALQTPGTTYTLRNPVTHTGVVPDTGSSTLAELDSDPLLVVENHGLGRAVQWLSINWIGSGNLGPVSGLDDLVWRSIVWAARKPFVMQGMPPFVTFRVDDVVGPYTWVSTAIQHGFKPWAGVFLDQVTQVPALKTLADTGNLTVSIHARSYTDFFYFDHDNGVDLSNTVIDQNFLDGTAWHMLNQIPISKVVVPHYYEIGTNAFAGLAEWGVEFVLTPMLPGNLYGADRLLAGPFSKSSTPCGSGCALPFYYADTLPIPNHPEYDGDFHVVLTEIRDIGGYEWFPSDDPGYLQDTIDRGVAQLKRALDGMELATIFTHEEFILNISDANWDTILAEVKAGVAAYQPEYVTLDYASQYVRAMLTSQIAGSIYNPLTGSLDTTLSGATDLPTRFYLFTETGGSIFSQFVSVPTFNGSTLISTPLTSGVPRILSGNAGVGGATLSFSGGAPVTADGNGDYSLTVPDNWSGTVIPARAGYTFSPASRSYSSVTANQSGQDYTASTLSLTISGNAGVGGAILNFTGGAPVTADGSGAYSLSVPYHWSGTVTPSRPGYHFTPASQVYDLLTANQSGQDYTASNTTSISIPLLAGWNMISIPLQPLNPATADVLASIEGNYDLVYAWDASVTSDNWLRADNIPLNQDTLTQIDVRMGLWVHMVSADILELTGTLPVTTSIPLRVEAGGWNLVGYPSAMAADPAAALPPDTALVFSYRAADTSDPWKLYDPNALFPGVNDLTELQPTWGYWIFVTANNNWEVPY